MQGKVLTHKERFSSRGWGRKTVVILAGVVALLLIAITVGAGPSLRQRADYAAVRKAIRAQSESGLESGSLTLRFEVYDAGTGELLPEVVYRVNERYDSENPQLVAGGIYEHDLSAGVASPLCSVSAPGYEKQTWRLNLRNASTSTVPVTFQLKPAATLSGRVVNEDGEPIPEVAIEVSGSSSGSQGNSRMDYHAEAVTDAGGSWSFSDVPPDYDRIVFLLRHPEYASDLFYYREVVPVEEQAVVLVMRRGTPFGGRVVDEQKSPVAGAVIMPCRQEEYAVKSVEDGSFIFPSFFEVRSDALGLSVSAPGFATHYLNLRREEWERLDYEVVLKTGRPLRVRFVGSDGASFPDTKVFVSLQASFFGQVHYFNADTDGDGILTVEDAPEDIQWSFTIKGHQVVRNLALAPGDTVHVASVSPAVKTALLVVDAQNGRPLDTFFVTPGYVGSSQPSRTAPRGCLSRESDRAVSIDWNNTFREQASRVFQGYYDDYADRDMVYRVEAEGYYPAQTQTFDASGGDVLLKMRLKRGETLRVRAVTAGGVPVRDAQAAWAPKNKRLTLYDGDIARHNGLPILRSDRDGWLQLPPAKRAEHGLVVVSAAGAAVMDGISLQEGQEIVLTAWGRLEGTMAPHITAFAKGGVRAASILKLGGVETCFDASGPQDGSGHFSLTRLYPGVYWVGPVNQHWGGNFNTPVPWSVASVEAGEISQVAMTGGRGVKARLEMPEEAWAWFRKAPKELQIQRESFPEGMPENHNNIYMSVTVDGDVWVEALPPGDYALIHNYISDPATAGQSTPIRFALPVTRFTIAEDPARADTPLDLGVLRIIEKVPISLAPVAGTIAPDFTVTTLDGTALTLAELRGRYVLLDFWATWCGPCRGETPRLKEVWKRYGGRDDFILISLSLDDELPKLKAYIEENNLEWPQVCLNGWDGSGVQARYGVTGIPDILLIGPDGKIVRTGLRGRAIMRTLRRVL